MILLIGVSIYFFAIYLVSPLFSLYVAELGGSYAVFGLIASISALVVSLVQSYVGYLTDKTRPLYLLLIGGTLTSTALLLLAITTNLWLVVIYKVLLGMGLGLVAPALFTFISKKQTSKGYSLIPYYRSCQSIGVVLGPAIGGLLGEKSLRFNTGLGGILVIFSTILFFFYFKNRGLTDDENKRTTNKFSDSLKEITTNKYFMILCLLFLIVEFAFDLIIISLPLVGLELGIKKGMIGYGISSYFLGYTLFQVPINNYMQKKSDRSSLILLGVLSFFSALPLCFNLPYIFSILSMAMIGITLGSLFTYCTVLASTVAPHNQKGVYMGVFNTIMPVTDVLSPIFVVVLLHIGVRMPNIFAVVFIALFLFSVFCLIKPKKNSI